MPKLDSIQKQKIHAESTPDSLTRCVFVSVVFTHLFSLLELLVFPGSGDILGGGVLGGSWGVLGLCPRSGGCALGPGGASAGGALGMSWGVL